MRKKNNLILIGFMGSGKTTIARALAKEFNSFSIDSDEMIELQSGLKIDDFFLKFGEKEFRKMEQNFANFIQNCIDNAVISGGGGFFMVKNLQNLGKIIYLKSNFDKIYNRLQENKEEFKKRPLLQEYEKCKALYDLRAKEYEKNADLIVEKDEISEICNEIILNLKGRL